MSPRQQQILHHLVEAYVRSAAPIGSLSIAQHLGVSSATVRAEMAILERDDYIAQPHTSAGRIPTDKGYRYYVDSIEQESESLVVSAPRVNKAVAQRITAAGETRQAMKSAVEMLAKVTSCVAVISTGDSILMHGLARLFSQPEFGNDLEAIQEVAHLLDNFEPWLQEAQPTARINVYIGQENPIGKSSGCSLVIAHFATPLHDMNYVGIVGPTRQSYRDAIRYVGFTAQTLEQALNQ